MKAPPAGASEREQRGNVNSVSSASSVDRPENAQTLRTLTMLYTCPMASHAEVVSDKPGQCPKCEMDLVPASTVAHGKMAEENWRKQHAQGKGDR
jgi:hypothetical protein